MRNKINLTTNCSIMICNGMQLDRKFTRIRIVLKTKIFFPSVFLQTNTRTRSVFESFSPVHTKTLIQWKKDSIFYRAYMTPPYSKTSVFVHLQENDERALKKTLWGPFSKTACLVSKNVIFLWTKGENGEKHLRFQKISGLCFTDQ